MTFKPAGSNGPFWSALIIAAGLAAAVWSAILWEIERDHHTAQARGEQVAQVVARAYEEYLRRSLTEIDGLLQNFRLELERRPDDMREAYRRVLRVLPDDAVSQFAVIGPEGRLIFSSLTDAPQPVDLSDREHFRAHLDGEDRLFISRPVFGRVSQKWSVQFTRRLHDARGLFAGVAVLSVDPDYFIRFSAQEELGKDGAFLVIGADDGQPRARSSGGHEAFTLSFADKPFLAVGAPTAGLFREVNPLDGVDRIQAWRRLDNAPLVAMVGVSTAEKFADSQRRASKTRVFGGFITAMIFGAAALIGLLLRREGAAKAALAANEQRLRGALAAVGDGVWDWRVEEGLVLLSQEWRRLHGLEGGDGAVSVSAWLDLVHPEDRADTQRAMEDYCAGRILDYRREHRMMRRDGAVVWVLDRGAAVARDAEGAPARILGTHNDISERKAMEEALLRQTTELRLANQLLAAREEEMRALAATDALTRLPNRRAFFDRADSEFARSRRGGRPLSIVMCDVDRFKAVNDTYGHPAGDAVLKVIAERCVEALRRQDVVARLGGEEFALLLPETDVKGAMVAAESVRAAIEREPVQIGGGQTLRVSASFGVAMRQAEDLDASAILNRADRALYQAKQAGRNRVCVASAAVLIDERS